MDAVTSKFFREQLQPLAAEIRKLADLANDPGHAWSAEDEEKWVKVNADYDGLRARAIRLERAEGIDVELRGPRDRDPPGREDYDGHPGGDGAPVTEHTRALAMQAWMRHQSGFDLTAEQEEAARLTGTNVRRQEIAFDLDADYRSVRRRCRAHADALRGGPEPERRAQSHTDTAGGFTIPQGFVANLETALLAYANVRGFCDVMRTDGGNDLPWPTVNDTTNKGALLSENTQISEQDVAFNHLVFHAYKYTTGLVLIPAELLEDSAFNLAQEVGRLFGTRLGRIQADHFTFGTGVGQPTGYVTAATVGVTTASSTAIAADEIYALKHSVDPAYRPGARFTFHDSVYLAVKKLKDNYGRYLWQSSLAGNAPDTIDGDPVEINQSMASAIATGNLTMAYGQMMKYKVRDVKQIRMRRLVERYADFDQEGFVAFMRCDGTLLDAGTHPIKTMKQL